MENASPQPDNDIQNEAEGVSAEFKEKLKACDPEIQHCVSALDKKNLKLQKNIGEYEATLRELRNKIKTLDDKVITLNKRLGGQQVILIADLGLTDELFSSW